MNMKIKIGNYVRTLVGCRWFRLALTWDLPCSFDLWLFLLFIVIALLPRANGRTKGLAKPPNRVSFKIILVKALKYTMAGVLLSIYGILQNFNLEILFFVIASFYSRNVINFKYTKHCNLISWNQEKLLNTWEATDKARNVPYLQNDKTIIIRVCCDAKTDILFPTHATW